MAGRKLFTNESPYRSNVTLVIRRSADPRNTAGTSEFWLEPRQSAWRDYGDNVNVYLNGIKLISMFEGQMVAQQQIVIERGSALDNQLNMYNAVDLTFQKGSFVVSTRQVHKTQLIGWR
jgi:hypothetical protein